MTIKDIVYEILTMIDDIKTKLPEGLYLKIVNKLMEAYNCKTDCKEIYELAIKVCELEQEIEDLKNHIIALEDPEDSD